MESNFVKVLDSSFKDGPGKKRKHPDYYDSGRSFTKLQCVLSPNCSTEKLNSGNKVNAPENHSGKSLVRYYSYFKKTGVPKRVMVYENREWTDLPDHVICAIKKDLESKRAAIEVNWSGRCFVLDFLHMHRLDLETGVRTHLAWIDIAGKCFFPQVYERDCEEDQCEIKLHLEVDVNGAVQPSLNESSEDSCSLGTNMLSSVKPADEEEVNIDSVK